MDPAMEARGNSQRTRLMQFVTWHETAFGTGPTLAQITDHLSVSRIAARRHLLRLVDQGFLTYKPRGTIETPPKARP